MSENSKTVTPEMPKGTSYEDVSILDIALIFWERKLILMSSIVIGLAVSFNIFMSQTPQYAISYSVIPVQNNLNQISGSSQIDGAANLLGVDLSGTKSRPFDYYLAGLSSFDTARTLTDDHNLLKKMYADQWDQENQRWRVNAQPSGLIYHLKRWIGVPRGTVSDATASGPPAAPGPRAVKGYLRSRLEVEKNENVQSNVEIYDVKLYHKNPETGEALLQKMHEVAEEQTRERRSKRTSRYIEYFREQLSKTSRSSHREALIQALLQQERTQMMTTGNVPYAADLWAPVTVSEQPVRPRLMRHLPLGLGGGLLFGVLAVLSHAATKALIQEQKRRTLNRR